MRNKHLSLVAASDRLGGFDRRGETFAAVSILHAIRSRRSSGQRRPLPREKVVVSHVLLPFLPLLLGRWAGLVLSFELLDDDDSGLLAQLNRQRQYQVRLVYASAVRLFQVIGPSMVLLPSVSRGLRPHASCLSHAVGQSARPAGAREAITVDRSHWTPTPGHYKRYCLPSCFCKCAVQSCLAS